MLGTDEPAGENPLTPELLIGSQPREHSARWINRNGRLAAFTLAEVVMFVVTTGIILGGILIGYFQVVRHSQHSELALTTLGRAQAKPQLVQSALRETQNSPVVIEVIRLPPSH